MLSTQTISALRYGPAVALAPNLAGMFWVIRDHDQAEFHAAGLWFVIGSLIAMAAIALLVLSKNKAAPVKSAHSAPAVTSFLAAASCAFAVLGWIAATSA